MGGAVFLSALLVLATLHLADAQTVTGISPHYGSLAGETRLTVSGTGFSTQFSLTNDPNVGSHATLVSESREFPCKTHKDGCTGTTISCYTPDGMPEDDYAVNVKVDGVVVPDANLCGGDPKGAACRFKPTESYTPTITSFKPLSGIPGDLVTMEGELYSDRYGSNLATSSNGRTEKLLRIYVGPQDCGMKENDIFYGLKLDNSSSDTGSLKCKTKGTSVGYFNGSFIVEWPFGRAKVNSDLYRVSATDKIYMYQAYSNITSISPATGSTEGGLSLTVFGNYFDNRKPYTLMTVHVGDTVCNVTSVVIDSHIVCTLAADPGTSTSSFKGGRGVKHDLWTSTTRSISDVHEALPFTSSTSGYVGGHIDNTYHVDANNLDNYVSRMETFFSPPHDGQYQFILKGDDGAKLFVDGTESVSSSGDFAYSNRMSLLKANRYLLQVVHFDNAGESLVDLKVKFSNTTFTNSMTGNAIQEKQKISVTSTVVKDVQTLAFSGFSSQTATNEVQTVVNAQSPFRFCLLGVCTEPLTQSSSDSVISTALSALPCLGAGEKIVVVRQQTSTPTYVLTFESNRGNFPDVSVVAVGSQSGNSTITETTKGKPDSNTVSLMMEGVSSPSFAVSTMTASGLQTAIQTMFGAQCPTFFKRASTKYSYHDFETPGSFTGTRVKDTDAFCGRYSLMNPWRVSQIGEKDFVRLSQNPSICFAYKGVLVDSVGMRYSYKPASDNTRQTKTFFSAKTFQKDSVTESSTWYYTCVDMAALAVAGRSADSDFRMEWFRVMSATGDIYIDSVYIGRQDTTDDFDEINVRRLAASRPNGALIDDVTVTESNNVYTVTLSPFECGNALPLFELANGLVRSGRTASPSTVASLGLSNGRSESVSVTRTDFASPPVTGSVDVTYNGVLRSGLNISLVQEDFQKELESLAGIGDLSVEKVGTCANFNLSVTFMTLSGDLPEMTVTHALAGNKAAAAVSTVTDGGLFYTPLTGDMLSTVHSSPQIRVSINDVPTKCSGSCDFSWSPSATPTVIGGISRVQGRRRRRRGTSSQATSLTITGTGFDPTAAKNAVTIGGVACSVTASTTTSITCIVGNGPEGSYEVLVNVAGKGFSRSGVMFSYVANIDTINPSTGSLGGGNVLTIAGYGFKSDATVSIGGTACPVLTATSSEITCTIPLSKSAGTKDVIVNQGQTTLTNTGYTYDASATASITSVNPSTIGVKGAVITIAGSNLGLSGSVIIGSISAAVTSRTSSQIVVTVGVLPAGTHEVKVQTSSGDALDGNGDLPSILTQLSISNVSPTTGSMYGGTKLTITGIGFGTNSSDVSVAVGSHSCDVDSVSDTEVKCQIADTAKVHPVTNKGSHPTYGDFYAFDKPFLTVEVGDVVEWKWTTPEFINDIAHSIIQVDSKSSIKAKTGGFSSGTPCKNGQYQYRFTLTGTFYVWSGFVDDGQIINYVGEINVVSKASHAGLVDVKVAGSSAKHNVGGSGAPTDTSSCKATTSPVSGCNDAAPTGSDAAKMYFGFWTCVSPVVSAITPRSGTTKSGITLTGTGFSTTNCQNEVKLGTSDTCTVTSSSDTSVTCNVDPGSAPEIGILHDVMLRVHNRGNALVNIWDPQLRTFGMKSNVVSISPSVGANAGGTMVTITGSGFDSSTVVEINTKTCTDPTVTYTQVTCETPASSGQGEQSVHVTTTVNGAAHQLATCETTSGACTFTYATMYTPTIATVTPDVVSGSTTLTITGTRFGTDPNGIAVVIGTVVATVSTVSDTSVVVTVDNAPAGDNAVVVKVTGKGKASGSISVSGTALISNVTPPQGSTNGGTLLTIAGNGFVTKQTTVTIGGVACDVQSVTLAQVTCITGAKTAGAASLDVTSNSVSYTSDTFTYSAAVTPTVTSVNPTEGLAGATLTISGSNFNASSNSVDIDGADCATVTSSTSQITCTLGSHATGSAPVVVKAAGKGLSNNDVTFQYQLSATSISSTTGGIAGGQTVTVSGVGFDSSTTVTIWGSACVQTSVSTTEFVCKTPAAAAQTCDVIVSTNGLTVTLAAAYTYDASLTPSITGVTPTRGGTGGGTTLTLQGSGFGTTPGDVSVKIDGAACTVTTATNTALECTTSAHAGSIETTVDVEISGNGIAQESTAGVSAFQYVDVWSSNYTWGGGPVPAADEFVVIPAGMTLLLDTDTPILGFLLIQGGKLIFDAKNLELQSKYILITEGGALEIGTEASPFQQKAIITLHGHHRSKELPIYGTKVLGVRNGTLDLHGIEIPITWTKLASTAAAGSDTITLSDPVEWNVGDEIVIASTGHRHSQSENEKKTISAISGNKMTLTLSTALEAEHLGTQETFDGTTVQFRAEVGLLTHNVVVRGNGDPAWNDEIEACPDGFNTGEFVSQTCFQGRFGDEIGSSQFGGMILIHSPVKDIDAATARLSYIEVTFAGQAFRLGRYPVHFHLNGDNTNSYVRGLGIHETFNRAVNIHGTHNLLLEKTVIYNIMGGAFFLEDGIEHGNIIQYNLAVFVRQSTSLLNDDITPAAFWVTNPDNIIRHNAAAGGSHFGFWYRMHHHPEGPSHTTSVCPDNVPLNTFNNNTAHSFGWFGLWIFTNYFPLQGGCGGSTVQPAVFSGFTAWNCEKGAEAVNSGALQFDNFVLVQNKLAGYEGKKVNDVPLYTNDSPTISNSIIVGKSAAIAGTADGCTRAGVVLPHGAGFQVKNVSFVNFEDSECACVTVAIIDGTCTDKCGGSSYHFSSMSFTNAANRGRYAWDWEGILIDMDGSLTGSAAGSSVVPTSGTVPSDCASGAAFSTGRPASICPPKYSWHRFAFNNVNPPDLEGKNFLITNRYGTSSVPFREKRISHKTGWMCALLDGETYEFSFENADQIKNISFTSVFEGFGSSDHIYFKMAVADFPDRFSIDGGNNYINATVGGLDPSTAKNGDWEWDNANLKIKTIVSGRKRSRRSSPSIYDVDRPWSFSTFKCYYTDCIPPPNPDTLPPAKQRSAVFSMWQETTLWIDSNGYITNSGGSNGLPVDYNNVMIVKDSWVVVNTSISKLGNLYLAGVLEFADEPGANYEINADNIIIVGGRLIIGWPTDAFDGLASIVLRGSHSSPDYPAKNGPPIGSKAIADFGGVDFFGKDPGVVWTKLSATATSGSTQISLNDSVTWSVDDEIVIGPTGFNPWQTETFRITAVSSNGMTLTLNSSLQYTHDAHRETLSTGQVIDLAAPVGLLTRNIKLIGEDYAKLFEESYGARVLVGLAVVDGQAYTGYARLSNVEFYHTGQEGWAESYDARLSVAFIGTGTVSEVKPSFVSRCAFHHGFNSAVGAFGIGALNITENVVHHTVGKGMVTSSDDTQIANNLLVLMVWTGAYQNRREAYNIRFEASIDAIDSTRLILKNNLVTASERVGYHVPGEQCGATTGNYANNEAHSNFLGVATFPIDESSVSHTCVELYGFTVWRSLDYGFYYNLGRNLQVTNNIFVENQNALFPMVIGPNPISHTIGNQHIGISNSIFVGATSNFDCSINVNPGDDNYVLSGQARPVLGEGGARFAVLLPQFTAGSNDAPEKPFSGIMSYNTIAGLMEVKDCTFAHFGSTCKGDVMFATNDMNEDAQHPVHVQGITMDDVANDRKIYMHRPSISKINSADCVDMECDAKKKSLIKDLDGSFLGHVGSVFSQSEYEWDGDQRRGLGDYRIPKDMLTSPAGAALDVNTVAPNKGIVRNSNCVYRAGWQAWECMADLNYEWLMIESMDADTQTRRLSPVGVLAEGGYIDLINGPQDHGWCSGYTCRKRVSLFSAVVATEKTYEIYFSSTTPFNLRYMMLNVKSTSTKAVKLAVWYTRPNRLDVYVDNTYITPANVHIDSNGNYKSTMPKGNEYIPTFDNATGTNFIDRNTGLIHLLIKGGSLVEVRTKEVIIVSFSLPLMTTTTFFGDNIVVNLAAFLNIPLTKVRVVNVVSAASVSNSGRKRRSSSGVVVEVEVGDEPSSTVNSSASNPISLSQLNTLASELVNQCQTGNMTATLNATCEGCNSVEVPASSAGETVITYSTPVPNRVEFHQTATALYEGAPLSVQPRLKTVDANGDMITELGTASYPWQMVVSIRSSTGFSDAVLTGTLTANSTDGWFTFTDLAISHMGTGYILEFNIVYPTSASQYSTASDPIDVASRPLAVNVVAMTSSPIIQNNLFSMTLDLRDANSGDLIPNIAWRNHTWSATAQLIGNPKYASLGGLVTSDFDPTSGTAMFPDLNITGFGFFYVKFQVTSSPAGFSLKFNKQIDVWKPEHVGMTVEESYDVEVKFDVYYETVITSDDVKAEFEQMMLQEYANQFPGVRFLSGTATKGSIMVTFTVSGSTSSVNSTAYGLCETVNNATSYTFGSISLSLSGYMTVNNTAFYGVKCGSTTPAYHEESTDTDKLSGETIAGIVIASVVIIALVVGVILWKYWYQPSIKTHNVIRVGDTVGRNAFNTKQYQEFTSSSPPPSYGFKDGSFIKDPFHNRATSPTISVSSLNTIPAFKLQQREASSLSTGGISIREEYSTLSNQSIGRSDSRSSNLLNPRSDSTLSDTSINSVTRGHAPFEERNSPMPPVGEDKN